MAADKPTTDDYSRFLDEIAMALNEQILDADRRSNSAVALALRLFQNRLVNGRSKRGL